MTNSLSPPSFFRSAAHYTPDISRRHTDFDLWICMAVSGLGDVICGLHQAQFFGRFYHAASPDYVRSVDDFVGWGSFLKSVYGEITNRVFESDFTVSGTSIGHDARQKFERVFVFIPHPHIITNFHAFADTGFLEMRCDNGNFPVSRYQCGGKPFGPPPANACEIL